MALVVKSWRVASHPTGSDPHVEIIARDSGLGSFALSLLGIDATTTFTVGQNRMEFQQGSLSGFERRLTPYGHVSSTFYGLHKPWKTALFIAALSFVFGIALMGQGTGATVFGTLLLFGGIGGAAAYYYLNRELMIGFYEDAGARLLITFKRSVVEGQEVNEQALEGIIRIIEHKLSPEKVPMPELTSGSRPASARMAAPAPRNLQELAGRAAQAVPPGKCGKCGVQNAAGDKFCSGCGAVLA